MIRSSISILLIISTIILSNLAYYASKKRKVSGALTFSFLILAMIFHSIGYAFEILSVDMKDMIFWLKIEYIGIAFYPYLIFLFSSIYADEKRLANRFTMSFVLLMNIITLILVYTYQRHDLYYESIEVTQCLGMRVLKLNKGVWYYIHMSILYLCNFYGVTVFYRKFKKMRGEYKKKALFMLVGVTFPLVLYSVYLFMPIYLDIQPFTYVFMCVVLALGLFRYDILYLTPITDKMVFDTIGEAVIVVDKNNIIINFNNSSMMFFRSLQYMKAGEPLDCVKELIDIDLTADSNIFELDDRILSYKIIEVNKRGSIYVFNDITESEYVKRKLQVLATTDMLTGIPNRRNFIEKMESNVRVGVIAILDIDYFKDINDKFGHAKGDEVLSYFGSKFRSYFKEDMICRYGGEEFALFIEDTNLEQAYNKIERFKNTIETDKEYDIKFAFSGGMALYENGDLSNAIITADQKLYEAKGNGRNQIRY